MAKVTNITVEQIDNGVLVTASSYDPDNYDPFGDNSNNLKRIYAEGAEQVPAILSGLFVSDETVAETVVEAAAA